MTYVRTLLIIAFCTLLNACGDEPAQSWDTAAKGAYSVSLSPNGEFATIGSVEHGGSLWRLADGERLYNWNHAAGQYSSLVASVFSNDSRFVITAERKRMVLWSVNTGKPGGFWPAEGGIEALALANGGRFALVGLGDYSAQYIDLATGAILKSLTHSGKVKAVAISDDGRIGVTGAEDGILRVWDLAKGVETFAYRMGDDISAVAISRDAKIVFGAPYYGKGKIWEVKTGKEIASVGHRRTTITCARFSADNKTLLTGFSARLIMLWNASNGDELQQWRAEPPLFWHRTGLVVVDVAFGKKPGQFVSVFSNGRVSVWDDASG